jgi:hypothetical protein
MTRWQAIKAKCKDCIYDPASGAGPVLRQIAKCSCVSCPLWTVRPMPRIGAFRDAPRDPATVSPEFLKSPGTGEFWRHPERWSRNLSAPAE